MSMVKISLSVAGKIEIAKNSNAWLVSFLYDGKDFTIGTIILSKKLEINTLILRPSRVQ